MPGPWAVGVRGFPGLKDETWSTQILVRGTATRQPSVYCFARQINCAATGNDHRIALEEGSSIPGSHLVKSCFLENTSDLIRIPADLFDAFVTPLPVVPVPDEPFDISPSPVGLTIMTIAHHDHKARLLDPDGARPVSLKSKGVVHVEEEMAAWAQRSSHGLCDHSQVCSAWNMIERIVFARKQIDRLRKPETPHVGPKYAYRQVGAISLLTGKPAHQRR